MKTVANLVIILLLHLASQSLTVAQIIFTRDTLLTGTHVFSQHVGVYDSSVTVEIESAQISFEQGMTVEYGKLLVRQNSTLVFANGYPLNISRNAHFDATTNSSFWGTKEMPIGLTLWKCTAYVSGCQFVYVRMSVMETWGDTIKTSPTFEMRNSIMTLDYDDMNPMLFSQGVNMKIYSNLFRRDDGSSVGQYPNIHIQSNKYTIVEQCSLDLGGISAGSILNSDIEIIDNIIENANKGISFWGVNKIEYNIFNNVNIGIEGGTLSNPLNDVRIHYNHILNNSELAIDVVGHNIVINENIITGSGETARGIKFNGSNSKITYNLLRDFKIDDSVYEVDGVALHIKNAGPGVEVIGNVFEHCGLSSTASFDKVCSIVYLESPVIFMSNDIRLSTLGGPASPTNSFAGGPVLDIISTSLGIPTVKYNLIHSNIFVALGSYEPTNTNGTLVAIDINYNHGMVEFKGNYLIGDPLLSLGVAIFPDGAIDSLLFEENTIMDNYVGIGTMQTPVLGTHNIIKDNTHYHIMRYGYGTSPTLYALSNNWDSDDPAVIDSLLFDDEEGINTGPIDFDFYYSTSYNLNVNYTIPPQFNSGDSLEFIIEVTDPSESPVADMPVFLSSSKPEFARFRLNGPITGNDGKVSVMLYAVNGGQTFIEVYAGDKVSAPIEVNVEGTSFIEDHTENSRVELFNLEQNYPNPFNPSTKIKYAIPQLSKVIIKVFDILGNEIEVLVNEEKQTGIYEIIWYAENLPSGVYFYQLKADGYIETKKMLLIK